MEIFYIIGPIIILVGLPLYLFGLAKERKKKRLFEKYGDKDIVLGILEGKVWQGMSKDMLIDSWGPPAEIDEKVLRQKVSETFKYGKTGKNRFTKRVSIENGIVIGWQV